MRCDAFLLETFQLFNKHCKALSWFAACFTINHGMVLLPAVFFCDECIEINEAYIWNKFHYLYLHLVHFGLGNDKSFRKVSFRNCASNTTKNNPPDFVWFTIISSYWNVSTVLLQCVFYSPRHFLSVYSLILILPHNFLSSSLNTDQKLSDFHFTEFVVKQ